MLIGISPLYLFDHFQSLRHLTKHSILSIKMRRATYLL